MSRRKQSNPKPLKAGDDETWTEDDEKEAETTTFDDSSTSKNKDRNESDDCSSLTIMLSKEEDLSTVIKVESIDANDSDQFVKSYSATSDASSPNECRLKTMLETVIKSEPNTSPTPSNSSAAINEHDCEVVSHKSLTTVTETKYHQSAINTIASDTRHGLDTLDFRQGFICPPCGIKFSSLSTLEAHQMYYCSHRLRNKGSTESEGEDGRVLSATGCYDQDESSGGQNINCGEPSIKTVKTGKQYRCTHCSYSADKKVSLNRHMRMHSTSPASSIQNDSDSSAPPVDRYCQECDIRFSNLKTFRAHKLHYCSTRNVINRSSNTNTSSSPNPPIESRLTSSLPCGSGNHDSLQPFIALPTNPVLIVPYSLIQAGNVFSGPISSSLSSPDSVYLLLPDGAIQMVTQGMVKHSSVRTSETSSPVLQPLLTTNNGRVREESTIPKCTTIPSISTNNAVLDLSTRRGSNSSGNFVTVDPREEEKENHLIDGQIDHEDIICAPSIPLILSTSSTCSTPLLSPISPESRSSPLRPSDKQRSSSPKLMVKTTKKSMNGSLPKSTMAVDMMAPVDDKDNTGVSFTARDAPSAVSGFNLSEMLTAAKELHFIPEMIPHLTAIQQMSSAVKRPTLNPITNASAGLPPQVSLGSSAVPDLVDPTILSLLNSELARRLTVGSVPSNVLQYGRQGTWKCEDCNIGFCKYENYVAHKKHYCSTRQVPESTQSNDSVKTSPLGSPSSRSIIVSPSFQSVSKECTSPTPSQQTAPLPPPPAVVPTNIVQNNSHRSAFSQFTCSTCGIKYSSVDNLTTHQTFYCPNRSLTNVLVDDDKSSLKCCSKCKVLLSTDQLPTHECTEISNTLAWKCPCCFIVCTSTNAIQKHFESHPSVKAFLCTICNYKGSTIRGMRTHIRVHFDKRNGDIVEENFISCLMDDSPTVNSTEDNLMEKTKKKSSLERVRLIFSSETESTKELSPTTVEVGEKNSPLMVQENVGDEEEYIEVDELPVVNSDLLKNETIAATLVSEENSGADAATTSLMVDHKSLQETVDDLLANNNRKYESKYCKSCDICFKYLPTYIAHKKYYCSSQSSKENTSSLSENGSLPVVIPTNIRTPQPLGSL